MSEDFLARWSRRKHEARRASGKSPDPARESESAPAPVPAAALQDDAITAEELAALPKLEELTAETDVSGFLRRGVPEALRNAALRKAWMLDPDIRDFVGHARDYAYDWNTPDGVPGSGALHAEEVLAMAGRVLGAPNSPHGTSIPASSDAGNEETEKDASPDDDGSGARGG